MASLHVRAGARMKVPYEGGGRWVPKSVKDAGDGAQKGMRGGPAPTGVLPDSHTSC